MCHVKILYYTDYLNILKLKSYSASGHALYLLRIGINSRKSGQVLPHEINKNKKEAHIMESNI